MDPEDEMPEPPVPLPVVVVGFIIWMYEGDLMVLMDKKRNAYICQQLQEIYKSD